LKIRLALSGARPDARKNSGMRVVEQYRNAKNGDLTTCEDGLFFNNHFAAVIDGVTSKSLRRWDGQTSGQVAMTLILQTLPQLAQDVTVIEAFKRINQAFLNWYSGQGLYEHMAQTPLERCSACLIIYSRYANQLWIVGDCQAGIDGKVITNTKPGDSLFGQVRAFFLESELLLGKSLNDLLENDTGREFILPLLERESLFQNTGKSAEFGSFAVDGFLNAAEGVSIIDVPPNTQSIVLASDGYPVLLPDLAQSEKALAEILKKDPLCFREFKSTKGLKKGNISFDDRAYIRLDL
jgi:hypothetical protein